MRFKDIPNVRTSNLFVVPVSQLLFEPGFNLRNYDSPAEKAQIRSFADHYKAGRYVTPLAVREAGEGKIYVVEGHLRTLGAQLAISEGATIVGLQCTNFTGNDLDRVRFMLASSQGLAMNPVGRAKGYARMINMGQSVEQIAEDFHCTTTNVKQYLDLAAANVDVQNAVERNEVAFTLAIEIVREHGDAAGTVIAKAYGEAKAAAETKAATAKPVKHRAGTKVKKAKVVKVTRKVIALTPAKSVLAAAMALCEKHAAVLAGKRDDVAKTTVMVSGADLLALFDALPAKAKAAKTANA